ncbi:hypothetical protein BDR06DRAFT_996852 [Suillus hirtellus]|nr:hypothetical protein BDR06DRAFT_996852 [Suillus hirtellus]
MSMGFRTPAYDQTPLCKGHQIDGVQRDNDLVRANHDGPCSALVRDTNTEANNRGQYRDTLERMKKFGDGMVLKLRPPRSSSNAKKHLSKELGCNPIHELGVDMPNTVREPNDGGSGHATPPFISNCIASEDNHIDSATSQTLKNEFWTYVFYICLVKHYSETRAYQHEIFGEVRIIQSGKEGLQGGME